jgi:hypothetical protein
MTDPRLAAIPKFLETPKDDTLEQDRKNLAALRRLARPFTSGRVIPSEALSGRVIPSPSPSLRTGSARDPSPPRGPG